MGPVGRVPSNFGDRGDQLDLVLSTTAATGCRFSPHGHWAVWRPYSASRTTQLDLGTGGKRFMEGNGRKRGGAIMGNGESHPWCVIGNFRKRTIRYDTRCYFNVRSCADISQLNPPHGTRN